MMITFAAHPIWILAFVLLTGPVSYLKGQVTYENGTLNISNGSVKKVIRVQKTKPGPVVIEWFGDEELNLLSADPQSYFEFVINGKQVSSLHPVWQYEGYRLREMGNGGTEITIRLSARKGHASGLELEVYQQIFPGSTLLREKLVILNDSGKRRVLNKKDNQLHFIFPQYHLKTKDELTVKEIRIASFANELIDVDEHASFDERFTDGKFNDHNLAYNHMYHPQVNQFALTPDSEALLTKGPINIIRSEGFQWISTYEHASQDDLRGIISNVSADDKGQQALLLDAAQGTRGVFNFQLKARDFHFLGFGIQPGVSGTGIAITALRGAYLDGERIDSRHPYASVWTTSAFASDTTQATSRRMIHDYLWKWICEYDASRKPEFYFNTWGTQRWVSSKKLDGLRDFMTEENIIEEIRRAADLNIDLFVLDDGWEQAQGVWVPHPERLPNGLAPIKRVLDEYGIKMGAWISPMGIDSTAERFKRHPEWVIRDSKGNPIGAQWDHPAFDFVSSFRDTLVEDCKKLVDQGVRFFKWDAINTFYSTLPDLHHGSSSYTEEERRARYEYLLPIYVVEAMQAITDYNPEVVIEIDLTEARRVMTGLAIFSQGKAFWMNNGASGYNDYSSYRAKSMRTIPNQYAGIIPLELFTYANYPHAQEKSMRYNVNTSLIAGHGFWGALQDTREDNREWIGAQVAKAKRVLPDLTGVMPNVLGRVGDSPEIYELINEETGAGMVIGFSGSAMNYEHQAAVPAESVLGVLNHAYSIQNNEISIPFDFPMPESTREAFIIPNQDAGVTIQSSTCWLDELSWKDDRLTWQTGAAGKQMIKWDKSAGTPSWEADSSIKITMEEKGSAYYISVVSSHPEEITITSIN